MSSWLKSNKGLSWLHSESTTSSPGILRPYHPIPRRRSPDPKYIRTYPQHLDQIPDCRTEQNRTDLDPHPGKPCPGHTCIRSESRQGKAGQGETGWVLNLPEGRATCIDDMMYMAWPGSGM